MYRNLIKMKAKADRNLTNGGTIKAKVKEDVKALNKMSMLT